MEIKNWRRFGHCPARFDACSCRGHASVAAYFIQTIVELERRISLPLFDRIGRDLVINMDRPYCPKRKH